MLWDLPSFDLTRLMQWNASLLFGSLLLLGLIGGHLVSKSLWAPRLIGYLLIGFALGSNGLNWLSGDVLTLATSFADVALALMVYQLGRYVDIGWLRHEKWLAATVVCGAALCFTLVWLGLEWLGISRPAAMLTAVLSIGTAPAVIMVVIRELNAEGQVTRRLAAITALNNMITLLVAYVLLPIVAFEDTAPVETLVANTLYLLLGSLLVAYLTYALMTPLARMLGRERSRQFVLVIAMITLMIGAAHALQLPVLLTMLAFAILSKNLDVQYDVMDLEFGVATELFIVMLFVTIGASISLPDLSTIGLSVAVVIGARLLAMSAAIFAFARPARMQWRQAGLLTLGTLPMAEAGLGLAQVSTLYPQTAAAVAPIIAGCLIVLEMLGPVATQFALVRSGESGRE